MTICQDACVLLLEDDALIGLDAEEMLVALGAREVLVAHSLDAAAALLESRPVDMAVLDLQIGDQSSERFALTLLERAIPFVFTSGYRAADLPASLGGMPIVGKPYDVDALRAAFAALG